MDALKIEHYEREHGSGTFLPFRHLSKEEATQLFAVLRGRLGLPNDVDPLTLVRNIFARGTAVVGVNADNDDFDLLRVLDQLGLDVPETVYLNWYRFDNIDGLRTRDLASAFDDVWYPSSDDLDILDSQMRWLVSITHEGEVRAMRL